MKKHVLIDGGNILHRAYYAFIDRDGFRCESDSGYQTGMIYGPLSMLSRWVPLIGGFDAVHMFLDGVPKRRLSIFPDYKKRDEPDPMSQMERGPVLLADGYEAKSSIDALLHILLLSGVYVHSDPCEEADDLIASFIRANDDDVHVIISSDKDFFQLLTNRKVAMYTTSENRFLDADEAEKYWTKYSNGRHPGVPVTAVRMFKTLCGDVSDAIRGVPRLRRKVAAEIAKSGTTLDELRDSNWPTLSPLERQHAQEMFDQLKLNWELIKLHDDILLHPTHQSVDIATAEKVASKLGIGLSLAFLAPARQRPRVSDAVMAYFVDSDKIDI